MRKRLISSSLLTFAAIGIGLAPIARAEPPQGGTAPISAAPLPGEDPSATQIRAAVENGVQKLRDEVGTERLTSRYTVGQFVDAVDGNADAQLLDTLRHADQIGGVRWVDNQTCQIKLMIPGDRVGVALTQIASEAGNKSPLPAEAVAAQVRDWNQRSYVATGSSIAASGAEALRPGESNRAWRQVDEDARRRAVNAAKLNAVERALDNLRPIALGNNQILGDVLASKQVSDQFSQWLASRPVTQVQFSPELFAELKLGVYPDEVIDELRQAARGNAPAEAALKDPAVVAKLRREIEQRVVPAVGRASVGMPPRNVPATGGSAAAVPLVAGPQRAVTIPPRPPQWVRGLPLMADATAPPTGSRLKTELAADRRARERLREQVNALPLDAPEGGGKPGGMTLGEAAGRSPAIAAAIDSVLQKARPYNVEFLADGSVAVKMNLDPRDLWDALSELP